MTRKRTYKTWKHADAGRCRNCGTFYIPDPHKGGEYKEGDMEEVNYCEHCALRCPKCQQWLPTIDVELQGKYRYELIRNDETGEFYPSEWDTYEQHLLSAQCPHCGSILDPSLLEPS